MEVNLFGRVIHEPVEITPKANAQAHIVKSRVLLLLKNILGKYVQPHVNEDVLFLDTCERLRQDILTCQN